MFAGLKSAARLLRPGLGLKRWLVPLLMGLIFLGSGIGLFLEELYAENSLRFASTTIGKVFPFWLLATLLGLIGLGAVVFSLYQLNKIILGTFLPEKATVA